MSTNTELDWGIVDGNLPEITGFPRISVPLPAPKLFIGDDEVTALYVGDNDVNAVYFRDELIF